MTNSATPLRSPASPRHALPAGRKPGGLTDSEKRNLRDQLEAIITEHRRLWLLRSREGGLDHSCTYYRNIEL